MQRTAWAVVVSLTSTTAVCSLPALLLIFTAKGPDTEIFNKVVNVSTFVCIYTIIIIKRHAFLSSVCISR